MTQSVRLETEPTAEVPKSYILNVNADSVKCLEH